MRCRERAELPSCAPESPRTIEPAPEPPRASAGRPPDQGAATIWAATAAALLAAYALALLAIGGAVLARHRAGAAADLGALAAAAHADAESGGSGGDGACAWAERAVRRQGAVLVSCRCADAVCAVTAAEPTPWGSAAVSSRAGPADDPSVDDPSVNDAQTLGRGETIHRGRLPDPGEPIGC